MRVVVYVRLSAVQLGKSILQLRKRVPANAGEGVRVKWAGIGGRYLIAQLFDKHSAA
jgi:hypothetical protein